MKASIYLFLLTLSSSVYAQTGVIAAKSHHASPEDYISEEDHFGQVYLPPIKIVDTVIYLGPGLMVEVGTRHGSLKDTHARFTDTIRSSSILKNSLPELKKKYSASTVFIGFEEQTTKNAHFDGMKRNGFSGILICILLLLLCSNFFLKLTHSKQNP